MVKQAISEKVPDIISIKENIEKKSQAIKKILRKVAIDGLPYSDEALQEGKYDILIEEMVPSEALDNTKKLGIKELSDN